MKLQVLLLPAVAMVLLMAVPGHAGIRDVDLEGFYTQRGLIGCMLMHSPELDSTIQYNPARLDSAFLPASTFKIPNSLIALETGVLEDEHTIIPWDGVDRGGSAWNRDLSLATALPVSAVWFYQEAARRIGLERMQAWIDSAGYGNRDLSGGIDLFWLEGGIRITARQQLEFMERLVAGTLPFQERTEEIVRRIMIVDEGEGYRIHAKTGWAHRVRPETGWYVGWVETQESRWFFAWNGSIEVAPDHFSPDNVRTVRAILRHFQILPEGKE